MKTEDMEKIADRIVSDLHFTPPEGHDWKLKIRVVEALEQVRGDALEDAAQFILDEALASSEERTRLADCLRSMDDK